MRLEKTEFVNLPNAAGNSFLRLPHRNVPIILWLLSFTLSTSAAPAQRVPHLLLNSRDVTPLGGTFTGNKHFCELVDHHFVCNEDLVALRVCFASGFGFNPVNRSFGIGEQAGVIGLPSNGVVVPPWAACEVWLRNGQAADLMQDAKALIELP